MAVAGRIVLFQGDSITDAGRDRRNGGLGEGYVAAVARAIGVTEGGDGPLIVNRGISGNRVSDLEARWNEDTLSLGPDVVSILIGINDVWLAMESNDAPARSADAFRETYARLLHRTRAALPNTRLALCEPFLLSAGGALERWSERRALLAAYGEAVRALAREHEAVFVALQGAFEQAALGTSAEAWLGDGVHPSAAGHELIAREWLRVVKL